MSNIWGIPFPYKSGTKNHIFGRFRNSTATLAAYILGMELDIHKRVSALHTTTGLIHRLETT